MRDNVSRLGTIFNALGLPVLKTSQTPANGVNLAFYNAATVYILAGTYTDGTHQFIIEESNDNGATDPWAAVAASDLVAWQATSPTNFTPVRNGNAQPANISSAATAVNQRIGYIGAKQYIRVRTVVTGSPATGAAYDVIVINGLAFQDPAAV